MYTYNITHNKHTIHIWCTYKIRTIIYTQYTLFTTDGVATSILAGEAWWVWSNQQQLLPRWPRFSLATSPLWLGRDWLASSLMFDDGRSPQEHSHFQFKEHIHIYIYNITVCIYRLSLYIHTYYYTIYIYVIYVLCIYIYIHSVCIHIPWYFLIFEQQRQDDLTRGHLCHEGAPSTGRRPRALPCCLEQTRRRKPPCFWGYEWDIYGGIYSNQYTTSGGIIYKWEIPWK